VVDDKEHIFEVWSWYLKKWQSYSEKYFTAPKL
jgi:hypothetical protein